MTLDEAKAALERGRPVVLVTPPAPEQAGELWELIGAGHGPVVIICGDDAAAEWALVAPPGRQLHAVTGLARSARILTECPPAVLAGGCEDLAALVARSALKLETCPVVVVAWPEALVTSDRTETLDTLLAAAPTARRIVLSWSPAVLGDFLERHARRPEVVGGLPLDADGRPLPPVGRARYAVVAPSRRAAAVAEAVDQLDPKHPLFWQGEALDAAAATDGVFCLRLPTRDQLVALSRLGEPIVFVTGAQLPYLRSIAAPLEPLRLAAAADQARGRADALRARIAAVLDRGAHDAELALLDPLFERFDPAEVAAALLALSRQPLAAPAEPPAATERVKVFVTVGKKDRASAKDLVGALIREVGLEKTQIGRIDVRDTFSTVEVAAGVAERVVRELGRVTIRGRRAVARLDRFA